MGYVLFLLFLWISGCENRKEPFTKQQFKDQLIQQYSPPSLPPVPLKPPAPPPRPPSYPRQFYQKVSIAINESIPLKNAFFTLSQQAKVGIQLPANIPQSVLFTAYDQPFIHVIQSLCDLANLRFRLIGRDLRIEEDTPYPVNYSVQFLNFVRTSDNHISVATDVFSQTQESSSLDNGSKSRVIAKGESNFWQEVKGNLATLLGTGTFAIHQQGGIISVLGTAKQHLAVAKYLEQLRQSTMTQVLIEAKVIEVHLKDEFKSGINWHKVMDGAFQFHAPLADTALRSAFLAPPSGQGEGFTIGYQWGNFTTLLKLIEEFGVCKILSSPRLTVMNNQVAILKAAQNQVYFRLHYDKQFYVHAHRENVSVTSDIQTVPVGWVLTVQPSIDPATQSIIIALRPTISRLSHSVADPAVDIALHNGNMNTSFTPKPSLIPVMEVREIESVLQLRSGETAVLGGLMEKRSSQNKSQLPWLADLAVIGPLFSSQATFDEVIELVILLKATILPSPHTSITPADEQLFLQEPDTRPF